MKIKSSLFFIFLMLFPIILNAQLITKTDTIYSTPELDGSVIQNKQNDFYDKKRAVFWTASLAVGDWGDMIEGGMNLYRSYLDFNLSQLPDTIKIQCVKLLIYQHFTAGNYNIGQYPQWDIPGGDTLFCVIDHIIYGDSLDTLDWTAGDIGDPQTLHHNIGIISKDSAQNEYKTMDVTEYVIDDINCKRKKSQYRIAFEIQEPDDKKGDYIEFASGDIFNGNKRPYLVVKYFSDTGIKENIENIPCNFQLHQNYPNPFNSDTIISYSLPDPGLVKMIILNVSGRKVKELIDDYQSEGFHKKTFSAGKLPSGIYFCKLILSTHQGKLFSDIRKITIVK